jgi:uncharacterized protein (DUF1697 family)
MPTYIALLRAINVAGRNLVAMSDLRDMLGELGFTNVQSLLQSGNLVFQGGKKTNAALEKLLETESAQRLNISADYLVRTAAEWQKVVAANPFPEEAESDPGHLVVMALKQTPKAAAVEALRVAIRGREKVCAVGPQLYAVYPDGIGRSKLTNALIKKHLATRGTARNWNTVLKLLAAAQNEP